MEDASFYILRIALSLITLLGILWCAVKYLVKYSLSRLDMAQQSRCSVQRERLLGEVKTIADRAFSVGRQMDDHLSKDHHRIEQRLDSIDDKLRTMLPRYRDLQSGED